MERWSLRDSLPGRAPPLHLVSSRHLTSASHPAACLSPLPPPLPTRPDPFHPFPVHAPYSVNCSITKAPSNKSFVGLAPPRAGRQKKGQRGRPSQPPYLLSHIGADGGSLLTLIEHFHSLPSCSRSVRPPVRLSTHLPTSVIFCPVASVPSYPRSTTRPPSTTHAAAHPQSTTLPACCPSISTLHYRRPYHPHPQRLHPP